MKPDNLIIHYHCLITISEFKDGSFLTVSGDWETIHHVHIRLYTYAKKISRLLKIDLNQRQQFVLIDRIAYLYIFFYSQTDSA